MNRYLDILETFKTNLIFKKKVDHGNYLYIITSTRPADRELNASKISSLVLLFGILPTKILVFGMLMFT